MFRFEHPFWLFVLLLVPLAYYLGLRLDRWRRATWAGLGGESVRRRLTDGDTARSAHLRHLSALIALAALIVALANPQVSGDREPLSGERLDVILAVDISRSMDCTDAPPSRMAQAREFARKMIDRLQGDRVGLISVAGNAETLVPLTDDYGSLRMALDNLSTGQAAKQGTALGEALRLSKKLTELSEGPTPVVVLVTDGENHEDDAEQAAKAAQDAGVTIFTVGVGSPEGAPVPDPEGGYKKTPDGDAPVVSRMDPDMLAQLAKSGGGAYYPLENVSATADAVMEGFSGLSRHGFSALTFRNFRSLYQWPLALALGALVLPYLLPLFQQLRRRPA